MEQKIYKIGSCSNELCPKPLQSKVVKAFIKNKDLAKTRCPFCKTGWVTWKHFEVHSRPRRKIGIWILAAVVSAVLLFAGAAILLVRTRTYTPTQLDAARQHTEMKTAAELCSYLPGSMAFKAKLLRVSRQTVSKIQEGKLEPGEVVFSALKGLAIQRYLQGRIGFYLQPHYPYDAYAY